MNEEEHSPPLISWPQWKWGSASWWLTAAGAAIAFLIVLVPAVSRADFTVRLIALAVAFIVAPLAIRFLPYAAYLLRTSYQRALAYDGLATRLLKAEKDLKYYKDALLVLADRAAGHDAIAIARVMLYKDRVFVALDRTKNLQLGDGDRLLVLDRVDGLVLGEFKITEARTKEYLAQAEQIDPVWLGFIRQSGTTQLAPPPHSVAVLVKERDDDG